MNFAKEIHTDCAELPSILWKHLARDIEVHMVVLVMAYLSPTFHDRDARFQEIAALGGLHLGKMGWVNDDELDRHTASSSRGM